MSGSVYTTISPQKIPQGLQDLNQWANWYDDKVIRNSRTGRNGSSTNPETWSTFAQALKADPKHLVFIFARRRCLAGIDLDGCRNPETGELDARAIATIERFPHIYWEISLSGTGLHGIGYGVLPTETSGSHPKGIGVFHHSRYFVMTGNVLPGHETLGAYGDDLATWYQETIPQEPERPAEPVTLTLGDHEVLEKLRSENNGNGNAIRLLSGDNSGYPDHSTARYALANKTCFYSDDIEQIARILRTADLFKSVDSDAERDRKANRDARKAAASYTGPRYSPSWARHQQPSPTPPPVFEPGITCDQRLKIALETIELQAAEIAAAKETIATRERVIERERELRVAAEERADRLGFERSQIMQVLRAQDLNPGEKLTKFGTVIDLGARIANGEQQTPQGFRLPAIRIAEMTGQKVTSVRRHWNDLAERGMLHKTNVRERTERDAVDPESGEITTATGMRDVTYIHVPENNIIHLITPATTYQKPEEKRGGRRVKCDKHPEAGTTTTFITKCDECGETIDRGVTHHAPESSGSKFEPEKNPVVNTVLRDHFSAPEPQPSRTKFEPQSLIPAFDEGPPIYWSQAPEPEPWLHEGVGS